MSTFHLLNFGCRTSQADGAALKKQLLEAGLREVQNPALGRVAILNTCTVTARADAELRQVIRRIRRANPECKILVTGCYAQRAPEELARLDGVAWVVGNSHKHKVADLLSSGASVERDWEERIADFAACGDFAALPEHATELIQITSIPRSHRPSKAPQPSVSEWTGKAGPVRMLVGDISDEFHFAPVFPDDRTRPTLKIQDGCDARCSFCIIPSVRGASRSLPPAKVIEQVRDLERARFKEIVLSGINLGSYGRDLGRQISFLGLLRRILAETTIPRLRISSIEPMDVSLELIRLAASEPRLAQHFHVPLQSGCDRILRQMNRRYWARQYSERLHSIRKQIPNCAIGADVMVGFPGETEEDHSDSFRFLESLPLTYVHVFPYSPRPTTAAASMADQVNGKVVRERSREIRQLIAAKHQAFLAAQVGRVLSALTLDETAEGCRVALSTNYLKISMRESNVPRNTLLDVHVSRTDGNMLFPAPSN